MAKREAGSEASGATASHPKAKRAAQLRTVQSLDGEA